VTTKRKEGILRLLSLDGATHFANVSWSVVKLHLLAQNYFNPFLSQFYVFVME
jgi:hypothetical protein